MIVFWKRIKFRWATAFKNNQHRETRSSLAEAAQASMKADEDKNLSLVDAAQRDIQYLARFVAAWLNRAAGEKSNGTGS